MPRGENDAFKQRVGKLSMPLQKCNAERMLGRIKRENPEVKVDSVDVEALLDSSLTWSENKQILLRRIGDVVQTQKVDKQYVENEEEKCDYLWEKFKDRNNITEEDIYARPKTTS